MSAFNIGKLACLSAVLLAFSMSAHGDPAKVKPCTNASLNGAYAFQEQGQHYGMGYTDIRMVGIMTFDGLGNATQAVTIWYSDTTVWYQESVPVTYSVNPDCSFTYYYPLSAESFTGVIAAGGQKLFWIETTGDPSRSGQAEKM